MVIPFLSSLFYFVLFSDHYFSRIIYTGTKIFTIAWPLLALWFIIGDPLPRIKFSDKKHLKAVPQGIILGCALSLLIFGLMRTPLGELVSGSSEIIRVKALELGILKRYWLFALFLSLANSLIEEYYWRWFVFGRLRKLTNAFCAHAMAGLSFAAHHMVVATVFFSLLWGVSLGLLVGAGGVVWSVMYDKQKTLTGAWISHLVVDLGIMCVGYTILFR